MWWAILDRCNPQRPSKRPSRGHHKEGYSGYFHIKRFYLQTQKDFKIAYCPKPTQTPCLNWCPRGQVWSHSSREGCEADFKVRSVSQRGKGTPQTVESSQGLESLWKVEHLQFLHSHFIPASVCFIFMAEDTKSSSSLKIPRFPVSSHPFQLIEVWREMLAFNIGKVLGTH